MEKYEFSAELYVYLPMSTKYTYLYLPTYVCLTTTIYQPLSTYHHLLTYLATILLFLVFDIVLIFRHQLKSESH